MTQEPDALSQEPQVLPAPSPASTYGCLLLLVALVVGGVGAFRYSGMTAKKGGAGESPSPGEARTPRAVVVRVAKVVSRTVPIEVRVVGNGMPYSTVQVISQVTGQLTKVYFRQGDFVHQGQPLFDIDARPQVAAVHQIEANLERDKATVAQARAALVRDKAAVAQARSNLVRDLAQQRYNQSEDKRYSQLLSQGFVTSEQAEQQHANAGSSEGTIRADQAAIQGAQATLNTDAAQVKIAQANLEADQAALENAQVQLSYTHIVSPLSGRTGGLNFYEGNLVRANDTTPLVVIDQLTPIYVSFAVPERYLPQIRSHQRRHPLHVMARAADQEGDYEEGTVSFIDNTVDPTSGTIMLRGTFPNRHHTLWPGRFINVRLILGEQERATVVPIQAVQPGQKGDFVFVLLPDMTVESRPVKVERNQDDDVVIQGGVKPGETVVTDGQLQLVPGAKVTLRGSAAQAPATPGLASPEPAATATPGSEQPPASPGGRHHRHKAMPESPP